jgi:hypothetical protein
MANVPERLARMTKLLGSKTNEGVLPWEKTAAKDRFQTAFTNYSVQIFERRNDDESTDVVIRLLNQDGKVIEEYTDADIQPYFPGDSNASFKLLRDLFNAARRSALGADKAIDDLLNELQDSGG